MSVGIELASATAFVHWLRAGDQPQQLSVFPAIPERRRRPRYQRYARWKGVRRRLAGALPFVDEQLGEQAPYSRLLDDAMAGNDALFTREDAVEVALAVVDPVLTKHHRARPYKRGSWGPKEADALIAADGRWQNPRIADAASD